MKVISEDFAIAGQISKGRGQSGFDSRTYAYATSRAENVSESEIMKNHTPNFFELIAKGDAPPDHGVDRRPSGSKWLTSHRPRSRSKKMNTHSPSMKCQYIAATVVAVLCVNRRIGSTATQKSASTPPSR